MGLGPGPGTGAAIQPWPPALCRTMTSAARPGASAQLSLGAAPAAPLPSLRPGGACPATCWWHKAAIIVLAGGWAAVGPRRAGRGGQEEGSGWEPWGPRGQWDAPQPSLPFASGSCQVGARCHVPRGPQRGSAAPGGPCLPSHWGRGHSQVTGTLTVVARASTAPGEIAEPAVALRSEAQPGQRETGAQPGERLSRLRWVPRLPGQARQAPTFPPPKPGASPEKRLRTQRQPQTGALLGQPHPHRAPTSLHGPDPAQHQYQQPGGLTPVQQPQGRTLSSPQPRGQEGLAGMPLGQAGH